MTITIRGMKNIDSPRIGKILNSTHDVEAPRPNGLKKFEIGDQIVWALNKENAERKAKLYPDQKVISG